MRTLNNYIQEKLAIFPSQVNEKLVIFPSQVNEKLVRFPSQVNEKLVINKSYKQVHNHKPERPIELIKIIVSKLGEPDTQKKSSS